MHSTRSLTTFRRRAYSLAASVSVASGLALTTPSAMADPSETAFSDQEVRYREVSAFPDDVVDTFDPYIHFDDSQRQYVEQIPSAIAEEHPEDYAAVIQQIESKNSLIRETEGSPYARAGVTKWERGKWNINPELWLDSNATRRISLAIATGGVTETVVSIMRQVGTRYAAGPIIGAVLTLGGAGIAFCDQGKGVIIRIPMGHCGPQ
ncbi:hypothetical protein AALF15_08355 [Corynebacteriaceae bacterium 7-707]